MRVIAEGSSAASIVRPVANTVKPTSAKAIAIPRPTPRDAPVTSAIGMRVIFRHTVEGVKETSSVNHNYRTGPLSDDKSYMLGCSVVELSVSTTFSAISFQGRSGQYRK